MDKVERVKLKVNSKEGASQITSSLHHSFFQQSKASSSHSTKEYATLSHVSQQRPPPVPSPLSPRVPPVLFS
ncbi:hypothetical protein Ahy_A03g010570 isoform B [Arachis hypogaea]|uniref:Uncharacterized protein n=1 Tax=Arachis hypogaea TaxID=3818 RepID=A0A445DMS5_ARAHY|nr:hypothetical protein Ahy_A03g010570 isoform B [Arachis hypogaea]